MKRTRNAPIPQRGFTLIELMVTVAIAAILLMVAVPGMTSFKRNAELTSATNSLLVAINTARGEAMKRGMNAIVKPAVGNDWNSGIVVFVDQDRDKVFDATKDIQLLKQPALASYFTVTPGDNADTVKANPAFMTFDPSGFARTTTGNMGPTAASTLQIARNDLTGTTLLTQTRRIMIAVTGRPRACKPASASDSQCSVSGDN